MTDMKKTGKLLLIFGIIALVSAIAFGCTVAAFGVANANYGISFFGHEIFGGFNMANAGIIFNDHHNRITYEFEKNKSFESTLDGSDLSDIRFELASCKATMDCGDTNEVKVTYTTSSYPVEFTAECIDGVLSIKEKTSGLSFLSFGTLKGSELTVTVPKTLYNSVNFDLASGKIATTDITSDNLKANVASGSLELGIFADNTDINLASGRIVMNNCTENKADEIKLQVASGKIEMNGFRAEETEINVASGSVVLNGISGKVKSELASGKVTLTYAEWDDDLDVELMSGSVDVTLPAGSGVDAEFEKLSGSMTIDLDGHSEKLSKNSHVTIGGSNVHEVSAETASGSVSIHN